MSLKLRSLGSAVAAARGIVMSAIGTGSPMSVTLTAGHRQRNGDRLGIAGNAADNGTFGDWSISGVAAASAVLDGSVGSTALSGTPVIGALMDRTPFLPKHSAVVTLGHLMGASTTTGAATCLIEKADGASQGGFWYDNSSGVPTAGYKDALLSGEIAIPAAAGVPGGFIQVEVSLAKYMFFRLSAWASGNFGAAISA